MIKQAKDFPWPPFFILEVYLFLLLKAMFLYLKDLSFACHWLAAILYYGESTRLWRKEREVKDVIFLLYKGDNGWFMVLMVRFFFF